MSNNLTKDIISREITKEIGYSKNYSKKNFKYVFRMYGQTSHKIGFKL